jgi:hypothetical protein
MLSDQGVHMGFWFCCHLRRQDFESVGRRFLKNPDFHGQFQRFFPKGPSRTPNPRRRPRLYDGVTSSRANKTFRGNL